MQNTLKFLDTKQWFLTKIDFWITGFWLSVGGDFRDTLVTARHCDSAYPSLAHCGISGLSPKTKWAIASHIRICTIC